MNPDQITLFLSETKALAAGRALVTTGRASTFRVIAGTAKWHDGTVDHGFKVRIVSSDGRTIFWL